MSFMNVDTKIFNKTLTSRIQQYKKELYTMTKWSLFKNAKLVQYLKNQSMYSTILTEYKIGLRVWFIGLACTRPWV
jgi:hypothetical protein